MALPRDYKLPSSGGPGRYMKFEQGANKFQVLGDIATGYVYWTETDEGRRPVRVKSYKEIPVSVQGRDSDRAKHFWACPVWNFNQEAVQLLEITQRTIQETLESYEANEDYGPLEGYPITVTRKGEGLETSYVVVPSPKKPAPKEALEAYKEANLNMEALYDGGDPFESPIDNIALDEVMADLDNA